MRGGRRVETSPRQLRQNQRIGKSREPRPLHRLGKNRPAIAAITTIRPAEFDVFVAPERHAARPAAARADIDFGEVKEFHLAAFDWICRRYRKGHEASSTAGLRSRCPVRTDKHEMRQPRLHPPHL